MKQLLILAFIATATLTSCTKECGQWYELEEDDCVDMRDKFYGTYLGTNTVNGQTSNTGTVLSFNTADATITWDDDLYMVLTGSTSVSIPLQHITVGSNILYFEGSGSINGNQLILTYTTTQNSQTFACSFIGSKQ